MLTGDELRERREGAGLTQTQLAKEIGVSLRTIGNWEREGVPRRQEQRVRRTLVLRPTPQASVPPATASADAKEITPAEAKDLLEQAKARLKRERMVEQRVWDLSASDLIGAIGGKVAAMTHEIQRLREETARQSVIIAALERQGDVADGLLQVARDAGVFDESGSDAELDSSVHELRPASTVASFDPDADEYPEDYDEYAVANDEPYEDLEAEGIAQEEAP